MSAPVEREVIPSPADELFYKGKLLPLQFSPRLKMVEKLLESGSKSAFLADSGSKSASATATPFLSCNVSPATSCYASGELNAEDYFHECYGDQLIENSGSKKPWSKKLKFIKKSSFCNKLKASTAYIKAVFTKSRDSDEKYAVSKAKECLNGDMKPSKKNPFGQIRRERSTTTHAKNDPTIVLSTNEGKIKEEDFGGHRRSFSSFVTVNSSNKSSSASTSSSSSRSSSNSSSFSSSSSNGPSETPILKRCSSANSDLESSIQGAIAYCKKSQQMSFERKSLSDIGVCFVSDSNIIANLENQKEPGIQRG
ncbi:putative membrane-associated kinase regulator 4 [Ananas comosus]|uniref:Putative membrane-associated kinase regulator 4 n=1 Tax=Ananas comosus TaxID=4615 RepID=A0A199W3W3_ANACO|nr:putative membrane-associated kinase regulator 4 [Ananas comosus]